MQFTEKDLDNLSTLARVDITQEEKPKMLLDMQEILGYISEINGIALTSQLPPPTSDLINVVRDDIVTRETGSNTEVILEEAPVVKDGYVKVEQVLK